MTIKAINKLVNAYKKYGFRLIIKIIFVFIVKLKKLSLNFTNTIHRIKLSYITHKTFRNKIICRGEGYYYISPMPSPKALDFYYKNYYWGSENFRGNKILGCSIRDFWHFYILSEFITEFLKSKPRTILNFGSGHGGISNIFWFEGHNIINVEPTPVNNFYDERVKHYDKLNDVPNGVVDLFYSSHSLEHVQDIEEVQRQVKRVLRPDGYIFIEVPNADNIDNGAMRGKVDIPHTYYFKKEYFSKNYGKILLNQEFNQIREGDKVENWKFYSQECGEIIRFLGQL